MLNIRFHPLFGDELKGRWTDQPAWERPRSSNFVWSAARSIVFTPAIVCSWTPHVVQPSVEIHVTSDVMADQKSVNMQSFETRRDELLNWVEVNAPTRVSVHELTDQHGPSPFPSKGGLYRSNTGDQSRMRAN